MALPRVDRHSSFSKFLDENAAEFNAIVRFTRGAVALRELHSEAWLVAADIEAKRGSAVDFRAPSDQQLVVSWVISKLKFSRRASVRTLSIDRTLRNDDDGQRTPWLSLFAAPENSDPLVWFLAESEEKIDWLALAERHIQNCLHLSCSWFDSLGNAMSLPEAWAYPSQRSKFA